MIVGIDLGSNTLRAVTYDCETKAFIDDYEKMVKTADNLASTGIISSEAIDRVIIALKEADYKLGFNGKKVIARTTAAMRIAINSKEVLAILQEKSGVSFEIIEAEKEAYFTSLAVQSRLDLLGLENNNLFVLDIGGGSTELIYCGASSTHSMSLNLGIVTLSQEGLNPIQLVEKIYKTLEPFKAFAKSNTSELINLVATAGTPTTIASMKKGLTTKTYDASIINGTIVRSEDLDEQLNRLIKMTPEDRNVHVGVGRANLIIVGVEIVKAVYDILDCTQAVVIDDGVREGIVLDACLRG